MEAKFWWKSYTVWLNVALLLLATVTQLSDILPLPPEFLAYVGTVSNVLLRFKTDNPIKLK